MMRYTKELLCAATLMLFVGCGESVRDGGLHTGKYYPSDNSAQGRFIDAGVEGLSYERVTGSTKITQKGGTFSYYFGEELTFKVGNLVLGKMFGSSTITPKELVSYKNLELDTSINSPEVNNRVRLLMSLDSDNNPDNGITISAAMQNAALAWDTPDFNLSESAFTTALQSATKGDITTVVSKAVAKTHFEKSLRCVYSGAYRGSWVLPSGNREGFVGVMIQSNGTIVALGDGQDLNKSDNNPNPNDVIYATGTHDMDTGLYSFSQTYHFDVNLGRIVSSNITDINGTGISQGYNSVKGSFIQDGVAGIYTAQRVGEGKNVADRYTGFGYLNDDGDADNTATDAILGLFTFDISRDGSVVGLIHDARTNEEPALSGTVDYTTGSVHLNLDSGLGHYIEGTLAFDGTLALTWYDANGIKLGYLRGNGCQLQQHD